MENDDLLAASLLIKMNENKKKNDIQVTSSSSQTKFSNEKMKKS